MTPAAADRYRSEAIESAILKKDASLFIFVGDLSADKHVATLLEKFKVIAPRLHAWGGGGPEMAAAGFEQLYNCQQFTIVGIVEVVKMLPMFVVLGAKIMRQIEERKPDAVLLVDFGGFNLQLAKWIRSRFPSLPIIQFISPQIWGSRPWRLNAMKKALTRVLVIFPFEEPLYKQKGISARFVGHPLISNVPHPEEIHDRSAFCRKAGMPEERMIIGAFPGSRNREVDMLLPMILNALVRVCEIRDDVDFAISQGNAQLSARIQQIMKRRKLSPEVLSRIHLIGSDLNYELMANADLIWAKGGTTALEITLLGTPMLIFYRAMWLSFCIYLMFKLVKRCGWPNLLSGKLVVPELIQLDCRAERLVNYTNDLLDVPALRQEMRSKLLTLRSQLGQGDYATNCAEEILQVIGLPRQIPEHSQANV